MPLYNFQCDCGFWKYDVMVPMAQVNNHLELCTACGHRMEMMWWDSRTNNRPFPAFVTNHLSTLEGKSLEITSLQQIRQLEKKYEDRKLIWEPGSYDSNYGDM